MTNIVSQMIQLHVFKRTRDGVVFLAMKRASDEPLYPNLWQVITGMSEEGESAPETAKRELFEETGLRCDKVMVLPYVASFFSVGTDSVNLVPVFAVEAPESCEIILSEEHQAYKWLNYEDICDLLPLPSHKKGTRVLHDFILQGNTGEFLTWV